MLVGNSLDQERRKQALRKRLALDFQPLQETLSKGLELFVDPEAAVFCTATVEGFCDALFSVAIKEFWVGTGPSDTKITVFHLQVALRSHPELAKLLQRAECARMALEFFLDDATSRALYDRNLIASREAKHLFGGSLHAREGQKSGRRQRNAKQRAEEDEAIIRHHERMRSEWQKRDDDPFTEVDFAMVLKCVHPAFTLSYNATMLLSALVRELLNEMCARADVDVLQHHRHPPELLLEDIQGPLVEVFCGVSTDNIASFEASSLPPMKARLPVGMQIASTASECLERYRLQSRQGKTLTLHFRIYQPGRNSTLQTMHDVSRDTPFATLLAQMRCKYHLPVSVGHRGGSFSDTTEDSEFIGIYRVHQVELTATPATLAMPTGAIVYLVARKWWDLTRRTEARRGLLSSQRPQHAIVRSLVAGTKSKVKKEIRAAANVVLTAEETPQKVKRSLAGSVSNSSLLSASCSSVTLTKSPLRVQATQEEDSLSVLLHERVDARRKKERTTGNPGINQDAHGPSTRQQGLSMQIAATSQQAIKTLDEAWLEFAALTTSVRAVTEQLLQLAHDAEEEPPKFSVQQLQVIQNEWRARVHSTEELASQTRAAHKLATQMLRQARS
ncbi:hypothetical protein PHMEG_00028392 [Phytophthora megakarya]|uniref:Uncharacterized protein n=1 Tax=Phytophthora megakarya TaxID=4795 RepID=A0A225V697_9STRA|nr:hypothetical protein PHMEG_00028392 [Phytophthora megakarya]